MHDRAAHLIERLGLAPHPEGGYFREVFRAPAAIDPADGRTARAALTTIYFLLPEGAVSRWHRVASAETWHYHEGAPLELFRLDASLGAPACERLGPLDGDAAPVRVVPAGHWQAARPTGTYTLVSCSVGPGFAFEDFAMLADDEALAETLRTRHPALAALL